MRETEQIQAEIDAAQVDLEKNVGVLKDLVSDKLEAPRRVVQVARDVVGFLRQYKWAALSTVALGLAVHWRRSRATRQVGF